MKLLAVVAAYVYGCHVGLKAGKLAGRKVAEQEFATFLVV